MQLGRPGGNLPQTRDGVGCNVFSETGSHVRGNRTLRTRVRSVRKLKLFWSIAWKGLVCQVSAPKREVLQDAMQGELRTCFEKLFEPSRKFVRALHRAPDGKAGDPKAPALESTR